MFAEKAIKVIVATAEDIREGSVNYAKALPSPCMSVCQMDAATGHCQGCLRTLAEIADWGNADEAYKRRVWQAIAARAASLLGTGAADRCKATDDMS